LTGLGEWAFAENPSLTSVTMGSSVTVVSNYAFQNDVSLTSVTFGSLVSIIGNWSFDGATALRNVIIPATVTYIGPGAYGGNGNLKSVTFAGAPPVSTGNHNQYPGFWAADSNTPSLGNVANVAVYFAPEFAVPGFAGGFTAPVWEGYHTSLVPVIVGQFSYEIVSGTEVALVGNTLVAPTDLTIPSSVTIGGNDYTVASIGFGAFRNSSSLTAVTIPTSVTKIGQRSFSGHPSLTSVTFVGAPPTTITVAGDLASLGTAVGLKVHFSPEFLAPSFVGGFTLPWWQGYVTGIIPFVETPTPTILGTTTVAEILTADVGSWSPTAESVTYLWMRAGTPIDRATSSIYRLQAADLGQHISVRVTAVASGYVTTSMTSAETDAVAIATFALTPLPTMLGTTLGATLVGQRLTAVSGAWSPSAAFTCLWLRNGVPIARATGSSYLLGAADMGAQITVQLTASRAGYTTVEVTSLPTETILAAPFAVAPTPTISGLASGVAIVGQRLTAVAGVWSPTAIFSYVWKRDGVAISGAIGGGYTLVAADAGKQISVQTTGSRTGYVTGVRTSTETSAVVIAAFALTPVPTISGLTSGGALVGQRLTAVAGAWLPSAAFTCVWLRNGVPIIGATGSSYLLGAADLGKKISVQLTGLRGGYASVVVTSLQTETIGMAPFAVAPTPTISGLASGVAIVGQRLTAVVGVWSPTAIFSYVWKRDGVAISGAIGGGYTLVAADAGKQISVQTTGSRTGYVTGVRTSTETSAVVIAAFALTPVPTISGLTSGGALVGQRLTAVAGAWLPSAAFTCVWLRNGVPIIGATGSSYLLGAADVGAQITVQLTASRAGYTTVEVMSLPTETILAAPFATAPVPTISGTVKVGQRLTSIPGTWSPSASFTYAWKRDGVAVPGAIGGGYTLTAADLGRRMTVELTGSRAGYITMRQTSALTVTVTR
jgi:hypothetical protein